ncbi:type 4 pilus major pilin [Buttiauxella gaviniae]|uniref:type 4 pilus major pilin n=1 Tax=Buttiauxella gaviniae TaxID=82990 RepID=UPI0039B0DD94
MKIKTEEMEVKIYGNRLEEFIPKKEDSKLIKDIKSFENLFRSKAKNKGFSLLEMILVLAVGASLVIAAFMLYPKIQASQRIDKETKNISTIQASIKSLYAGKSRMSGLSSDVLIASNSAPDNMIQSGKLVSEWKGSVNVEYSGNHGKYNIIYDNVPADACSRLITAVAGSFVSITIYNASGSNDVKNLEEGFLIDAIKTANACAGDISSTIYFTSII